MDKRQLWSPTVVPSWCCACSCGLLVSIPRDFAVVPAGNSFLCGWFSRVQKSWGDFLFPCLGWDGDPVEGKACHRGAQWGEQLCWHLWEAVPGTKHNLSKCSRRCPAITMSPFLLYSNYRKCGIVVTAGSLSVFSNPCLLSLLSSSCCACVSKHVPFLLLCSVLRWTTLAGILLTVWH